MASHLEVDLVDPALDAWRPDANLPPGGTLLVAVDDDAAVRSLRPMRWGLVPPWADDPAVGYRMINARSETAASKPSFRRAVASRRALVSADGFFEWFRMPGGTKQPYLIRRTDGAPLALGAIWERWSPGAGEGLVTVSVLTTTANRILAPVHDRMPVVLGPRDWDEWLRPVPLEAERWAELCGAAGDDVVERLPVSTRVNDARNKGEQLLDPVEAPPGAPVGSGTAR